MHLNLNENGAKFRTCAGRDVAPLSIAWETDKLTRYQSREFSCYILKSEQTQKHTRKLTTSVSRSHYSFPARDWSLVFDPEKPTFSVSSEHKTTYKRPGSYSLPYSLPSLWNWYARESLNSHHLITQRDNIHARAPDMCVNPRGYMTSGWRNLF